MYYEKVIKLLAEFQITSVSNVVVFFIHSEHFWADIIPVHILIS